MAFAKAIGEFPGCNGKPLPAAVTYLRESISSLKKKYQAAHGQRTRKKKTVPTAERKRSAPYTKEEQQLLFGLMDSETPFPGPQRLERWLEAIGRAPSQPEFVHVQTWVAGTRRGWAKEMDGKNSQRAGRTVKTIEEVRSMLERHAPTGMVLRPHNKWMGCAPYYAVDLGPCHNPIARWQSKAQALCEFHDKSEATEEALGGRGEPLWQPGLVVARWWA